MKALSLIFLCAALVHPANAQSGAKQKVDAANQSRRDGMITGRVIDDQGRPAAGASILIIKAGVRINSGFQKAIADDEGNFKAGGLASGSYRIFTNVPGYVIANQFSESDYHYT